MRHHAWPHAMKRLGVNKKSKVERQAGLVTVATVVTVAGRRVGGGESGTSEHFGYLKSCPRQPPRVPNLVAAAELPSGAAAFTGNS
ncbi:hypothetical protein E2C01_007020 [Portunus trituberculatus]|uniref:Uncharacterized protein n=1 Tax=Portunus trituberculatus TaxID=210409 RepID=A0A5B7CYB6_PORTR|nr:hypothetical protein [Portunus trituberculatus]